MGFSIGRFLGAAAPLIGATFGPIGAAVGAGIGAGFAARSSDPVAAATIGRATQVGPISAPAQPIQFQQPQFGASSVGPTLAGGVGLPRIIRDLGTGFGLGTLPSLLSNGVSSRNPISVILAKARAATGGPVTRNKIIEAAKACGLEVAASTFGLSVNEICMVVVKGRTRRRRGVSAADIRRTKRTIGFASKIRKDLKALAK